LGNPEARRPCSVNAIWFKNLDFVCNLHKQVECGYIALLH
jgi:hypothetical protein